MFYVLVHNFALMRDDEHFGVRKMPTAQQKNDAKALILNYNSIKY